MAMRGAAAAPPDPAQRPPDVLLVTVDALRADHLGFLGGARETSPALDALAAKSVVFEDAWSASSWTPPSLSSLLTGLLPVRHGNPGGPARLPEEVETLAETLRAAGWRTRAAVQNSWLSPEFGLGQGFDEYRSWPFTGDPLTTTEVQDDLSRWMSAGDAKPFFLWVHHFSPHCPYVPREPWISRFSPPRYSKWAQSLGFAEMQAFRFRMVLPQDLERFTALYDSEIAFTDEAIGRLLRALPRPEETLVIVTADHGEEFKDHGGLGHYRHLHREVARIPLLVRLPGQDRSIRCSVPVSGADVVPTVRAALGLPSAPALDGKSLLRREADGTVSARRDGALVFSMKYAQSYDPSAASAALARGDTDGCAAHESSRLSNQFAVRDPRWTLLCDTSERDMDASRALDEAAADATGRPRFTAIGRKYVYRLFDRIADPGETLDVAARFPAETRRLALALRDEFRRAPLRLPTPIRISAEAEESLRGLGYVK